MVAADEGPRRRSGRIAGLEADGDAFKAKVEEEEKEREILRVVSRKEREQVMDVGKMVEDTLEDEIKDMVGGVPFFFFCLYHYVQRNEVSTSGVTYRKSIFNPSPSYRIPGPIPPKQYPPMKRMPTLIPPCLWKSKDSKMLLKI